MTPDPIGWRGLRRVKKEAIRNHGWLKKATWGQGVGRKEISSSQKKVALLQTWRKPGSFSCLSCSLQKNWILPTSSPAAKDNRILSLEVRTLSPLFSLSLCEVHQKIDSHLQHSLVRGFLTKGPGTWCPSSFFLTDTVTDPLLSILSPPRARLEDQMPSLSRPPHSTQPCSFLKKSPSIFRGKII